MQSNYASAYTPNPMQSTIGVLGIMNNRTPKDQALQRDFNCARPNSSLMNVSANGIGIMGSDIAERSQRDRMMMNEFGCGYVENFSACSRPAPSQSSMLEPRSVKDQVMLREFNSCSCKPQMSNDLLGLYDKENYTRRGANNFEGYCGTPYASITDNPYNSSTNVSYKSII